MGKLPNVIPYYNTIINDVLNLYATKFAKKGSYARTQFFNFKDV